MAKSQGSQHARSVKSAVAAIDKQRRQAYGADAGGKQGRHVRTIRVVAEGDSWFSYFPPNDILACLRSRIWGDRRYAVYDRAKAGALLNDMVYGREMVDTYQLLQEHDPDVFLFSGGGNDIAGSELFCMLFHKMAIKLSPGLPSVNRHVLRGVVDEILGTTYQHMIDLVREKARQIGKPELPIVVHGYGHAIPDGRGWGWLGGTGPFPGPWLDPSLTRKGYDREQDRVLRRDLVRELIDAFNEMLGKLSRANQGVHYVDLREVILDKQWANELHPDKKGFLRAASEIEAKLRQLLP